MAVRLPGTIGLMLRRFTPEFRYGPTIGVAGGHNRYAIWIYPEDITSQQEIIVVVDRRPVPPPLDAVVRTVLRLEGVTGGPGTITFILDGPLGQAVIRRSDPGVLTANEWQHIQVVCDTSLQDCHIYRNGVEVSYAFTHNGFPLGGSGGSDVLFGSTYRGGGVVGPHYPGGTIVTFGSLGLGFTTAPGDFFRGGIAHAGLWHEGVHSISTGAPAIQGLADGFAPTFFNHFLEDSSISVGLLMAPAFYGDGNPLSGYDPEQEHDPVSGIRLEYTIGSGEATWMDGPGVAEPCPPDIEGPGPPVIEFPRLCLPFGLPRAEVFPNPGNPADLLPIVYGDFRVGGVSGPIPSTLIDQPDPDTGVDTWTYCGAAHPVVSVENIYIGDIEQSFSLDTVDPDAAIVVRLGSSFQGVAPIMSITFRPNAANRMLSPEGQPIRPVTWRGRGMFDETGLIVMENCIDQLVHLLTNWGNFDEEEDFDQTSLAESRATVETLGYKTAFVIFNEEVTQDWLTEMLFNVMGYWRINGLQQVELRVDAGADFSIADLNASVLASRDCLNGDDGVMFTIDRQHLVNKLTAYYLWNYATNQASSRLINLIDNVSFDAYGPMEKAVTLKGLRRAEDVAIWAAILLMRQSARTRVEGGIIQCSLNGGQFTHLSIGDLIAFSWVYGPIRENGNAYMNEILRIIELTLDASRGGAVQITAVDLGMYVSVGGARVLDAITI